MDKKLLSHELSTIESCLRLALDNPSKSKLEDCIKAVSRARAYLQTDVIQNILGGKKDEIAKMLEEVTVSIYKIPNFDNTFIESLNDYYKRRGTLTDGQNKALEKLHEKLCQRKCR